MGLEELRLNLSAVRANAKMSQKEWAEAIGVSVSTVVNWEADKTAPSVQQLRMMSKLAHIPMDYIFVREEYD